MSKKKFDWYNNLLSSNFDPLNIKLKEYQSLLFIGDIHEQWELYYQLKNLVIQDELSSNKEIIFVSLGDIFDKGYGLEFGLKIFYDLKETRPSYILCGNHEAKKIERKESLLPIQEFEKLPKVLSFVFESKYRVTAMHAGVTPKHTWNDLKFNNDVLYTREIDENDDPIPLIWVNVNNEKKLIPKKQNGINWHEKYDGRFGFIVSGHQMQKDGVAKFYKHSCNIDSGAYLTGILTGALFDQDGLKKIYKTSK